MKIRKRQHPTGDVEMKPRMTEASCDRTIHNKVILNFF